MQSSCILRMFLVWLMMIEGGVVFYLGVTTCIGTQQQECARPEGRRTVVWDGAAGPHLWAGLVGGEQSSE